MSKDVASYIYNILEDVSHYKPKWRHKKRWNNWKKDLDNKIKKNIQLD